MAEQPTMRERFDAKWVPEPNTGCWLWTAFVDPGGYGRFSRGPTRSPCAHRAAWHLYRYPIPDGMVIDHKCRQRSCVNPDHLRVVTVRVNCLENSASPIAAHAKRTHCRRCGAELVRIRPSQRACRRCVRVDGLAAQHRFARRRRIATGLAQRVEEHRAALNEICDMYRDGVPIGDIFPLFGVTRQAVHQLLKRRGLHHLCTEAPADA